MRKIIGGALVLAVFVGGTVVAVQWLGSSQSGVGRPELTKIPDLPAATRSSRIVVPVAVALVALRDTLETTAPKDLAGSRQNPLGQILGKADIGWNVQRGALTITGRPPDSLTITTPLTGSLRVTGQIAGAAGAVTDRIAGFASGALGRTVGQLTTKTLDQRADVRGSVAVTARPMLQSDWRIEPNLSGQASVVDGGLTVAGFKLNTAGEIKPLLDRSVKEAMARLQNQMRNDRTLEQTARREWTKMCRSIPLGAAGVGAPDLWLELRPTRAYAAQPRITADWAILTVGVQAETRITPKQTRPECPFPARLELVPQLDQGSVAIALPIDLPFTALNRLLEEQLKDRTFPDDGKGAAEITVRRATVAASGDRLLISLQVRGRERRSWFGFGADATVHVWGRPTLDRKEQVLRLTDISLAVESEAAFGLLGAAARAAMPYLQSALAENAVIDLKPFAKSAKQSIAKAIADFQGKDQGINTEAAVTGLRLIDIAFDSHTLRVVAEADGMARVAISRLPNL